MYIDGDFIGIKLEPESDDVAEFPPDDNPTTGMLCLLYVYRYVSCMYTQLQVCMLLFTLLVFMLLF